MTQKIFVLARMTFLESVRERIFILFFIFGILLFGLSVALGNLSFFEQERIASNFGLSAIHLISCCMAIFVGVTSFYKELDRKTVNLILSKPINRLQFLLGKSLGVAGVQLVFVVGLGAILGGLLSLIGVAVTYSFLIALFFIFIETLVLLCVALFCINWSRPAVSIFLTFSFFLIGHWLDSLLFFANKSPSKGFKLFGQFIAQVWPNLEMFNFRNLSQAINIVSLVSPFAYGIFVGSLFLGIAYLVFKRRDLV